MTPEIEITHSSDTHLYFTVMEGETDTSYRIAKRFIRMETSVNPFNDSDPTYEIDDVMDYYDLQREGMHLEIKDIILEQKEHWKDDTLAFRMAEQNLQPY
jgi:hypothetical protein